MSNDVNSGWILVRMRHPSAVCNHMWRERFVMIDALSFMMIPDRTEEAHLI